MILAVFKDCYNTVTTSGLYQYDSGQILRVEGLKLPETVEVHFSLFPFGVDAPRRLGTIRDGGLEVEIPDVMLNRAGVSRVYYIYAFIYITKDGSSETVKCVKMEVKARPKPADWMPPNEPNFGQQLIESVVAERDLAKEYADSAKDAKDTAEAWAHGHEMYPELAEDNAKFYAQQAKNVVQVLPSHVEDAKRDIDAYTEEKKQELKGDTGNVYFASFKVVGGRLKMYSDPTVDKVRFVRNGSRLAYRLAF